MVDVDRSPQVTLAPDLLRRFGLPDTGTTVLVEPLVRRIVQRDAVTLLIEDEEKAAIRDWLMEKGVNRQLLRGLRRGAARWLRATDSPMIFFRDSIARPNGLLRCQTSFMATQPPICIEAVEECIGGIFLSRQIGLAAFDLHAYAKATGKQLKVLATQLAQERALLDLSFRAQEYRRNKLKALEAQLDMSCEELALYLFIFSCKLTEVDSRPHPGFSTGVWEEICQRERLAWRGQIGEELLEDFRRLFSDFFKLRENVWDGARIQKLIGQRSIEDLLGPLVGIEATAIHNDYRLRNRPLNDALAQVQRVIRQWLEPTSSEGLLSDITRKALDDLESSGGMRFADYPLEVWMELEQLRPEVLEQLYVTRRK
jgi:hypothetical protein